MYYQQGKTVFLSGGALGFDTLAAQTVLQVKTIHPEIRLILAIPCPGQSDRWSLKDRQTYQKILLAADERFWVSDFYFPGCMQKRNRFLIDHSDTCLCYLKNTYGGTWNTVSYAYDRHCKIHNIAQEK